eukprot:8529196-Pyramimonas_sp.AAC.1
MEYTCYHSDTSATDSLRLTGEVTHDVPDDVRQTIEWNWKIPVEDLEFGFRIMRGYIACPSEGFLTRDTDAGYDNDKCLTDVCALDCRIRAAVETDDLIEAWARDIGRQGRVEIRRQGMKLQDA